MNIPPITTVPQVQAALIGAINTACSMMTELSVDPLDSTVRRPYSVTQALDWLRAIGFGSGRDVETLRGQGTHGVVWDWVKKFGINPDQAPPTPYSMDYDLRSGCFRFEGLAVFLQGAPVFPEFPGNGRIHSMSSGTFGSNCFPTAEMATWDSPRRTADLTQTGGLAIYLYPWEAMYLNFAPCFKTAIPYAVRVETGGINAVTGDTWEDKPARGGRQDYVVAPNPQLSLGGFMVDRGGDGRGTIQQFVAPQLATGGQVADQGLRLTVAPMRPEKIVEFRGEEISRLVRVLRSPIVERMTFDGDGAFILRPRKGWRGVLDRIRYSLHPSFEWDGRISRSDQKSGYWVEKDPFGPDAWAWDRSASLYVRMVPAEAWKALTGREPQNTSVTRTLYDGYRIPWPSMGPTLPFRAEHHGFWSEGMMTTGGEATPPPRPPRSEMRGPSPRGLRRT